jgi:hypothetical protein
MHWFWRAAIGALVGFVIAVAAGLIMGSVRPGGVFQPTEVLVITFIYFLCFLSGTTVAVRLPSRQPRCRRCGYILRGLTEPRCPECGERI